MEMDISIRIFESLKLILSKTKPAVPIVRPNALESSPFYKLPPELICIITDNLPLESVGSLSLSCRPFYSLLKTKYQPSVKEVEYLVMQRFLYLLVRDLPAHIVCPKCNKLHYMLLADRHLASPLYSRPSKRLSECRLADLSGHYIGGIPAGFSSTIFRMAMKAHRQGDYSTANSLVDHLSYRKMDKLMLGFVGLHKTEARIYHGSLYVREQKVYMVPASQKIPLPWYGGFGICSHIPLTGISQLYWYDIHIPKADEIDGYENKQGILYCQYCHTEFSVDFKSYGKAGNAVFITQWIDFGKGQEEDDYKRRSRLGGITRWKKVAYQRGSICAAFEMKEYAEFKCDSTLTEQDEKELCTGCYWPWPGDTSPWPHDLSVLDKADKRGYVVRNGRLIPQF